MDLDDPALARTQRIEDRHRVIGESGGVDHDAAARGLVQPADHLVLRVGLAAGQSRAVLLRYPDTQLLYIRECLRPIDVPSSPEQIEIRSRVENMKEPPRRDHTRQPPAAVEQLPAGAVAYRLRRERGDIRTRGLPRGRRPCTRQAATYRRARDFEKTAEPMARCRLPIPERRAVIQKHAARRLHYDLRLEDHGVFKSWAATRGPSSSIQPTSACGRGLRLRSITGFRRNHPPAWPVRAAARSCS